jgi:hypothetical protein
MEREPRASGGSLGVGRITELENRVCLSTYLTCQTDNALFYSGRIAAYQKLDIFILKFYVFKFYSLVFE